MKLTHLKYLHNHLSLVKSSSELSRLLVRWICGILGTAARNPEVGVSAPEAWKSPGLVGFISLSLHLFTFLAFKARHFSGKQDTKRSMKPVLKILPAILLLMCMKYVQSLTLTEAIKRT